MINDPEIQNSKQKRRAMPTNVPLSRLFTFTDRSADVKVECYLHTSEYAAQGWYQPAERVVQLNKPFQLFN